MRKHGASDEDALYESPNHRPPEMGERAALRQTNDDLMTIIDFCDAMARGVEAGENDPDPMLHAIRGAHDIAHVLEGGDSVTDWTSIRYFVRAWPRDHRSDFGPAWPDVRERMVDVLARAEEMTR